MTITTEFVDLRSHAIHERQFFWFGEGHLIPRFGNRISVSLIHMSPIHLFDASLLGGRFDIRRVFASDTCHQETKQTEGGNAKN
ncbi:hypothetical protein [Novipirellula rosea]|uniref:Uncharacterized protein n=1 Tax=Novipirellula rosea TaxID=1031540 RepID=A0ABP8MJ21_9BACT